MRLIRNVAGKLFVTKLGYTLKLYYICIYIFGKAFYLYYLSHKESGPQALYEKKQWERVFSANLFYIWRGCILFLLWMFSRHFLVDKN